MYTSSNRREETLKELQDLKYQLEKDSLFLEKLAGDISSRMKENLKKICYLEQNINDYTTFSTASYTSLFEVFKKSKLLSAKWEQFFPIYERYLSQYVKNNQTIDLLELGVQNGGSLEMWKKYFVEGSTITGVDIDPRCQQIPLSDGINFLLGSAADAAFVEENLAQKEFDVIIDDASHLPDDVINSFELLFPKLKSGGLYIIEDVHTSYWKEYKGGFRNKQSHMEYFKNITDVVNFNWISESEHVNLNEELPYFKKLSTEVAQIAFYDSVIVIEKYVKPMTRKFNVLKQKAKISITDYRDAIECSENSVLERIYR